MAYADDLLEQARHLAELDEGEPKQASLRRAVSTAYYALFHLLIDEAVGNWGVARQRGILARTFDHGKMKKVCEDHIQQFKSAGSPPDGEKLMSSSGIRRITIRRSCGKGQTPRRRLIWQRKRSKDGATYARARLRRTTC